jgi:hypothetical protein
MGDGKIRPSTYHVEHTRFENCPLAAVPNVEEDKFFKWQVLS